MDQRKYLDAFKLMCDGMVKKDKKMLEDSMTSNSSLYHMSGKKETRNEYINDILNGILNYYDYEIINFNQDKAVINLYAKVYGMSKSWWKLSMNLKYEEEAGLLKIKECKVSMA